MAQLDFSTVWSGFTTAEEAKTQRDAAYKHLRALGYTARRSVLKGQLRKWASLGVPDGRICDVYTIDTNAPWEIAKGVEQRFIDEVLLRYAEQKHAAQVLS